MDKCPKCGYEDDMECKCRGLTVFDIDIIITGKYRGKEQCLRCGKFVSDLKYNRIMSRIAGDFK